MHTSGFTLFAQQFYRGLAGMPPVNLLWLVGAVLLGIFALKVAAKIAKFLLVAAVIVFIIGFLLTSGIV